MSDAVNFLFATPGVPCPALRNSWGGVGVPASPSTGIVVPGSGTQRAGNRPLKQKVLMVWPGAEVVQPLRSVPALTPAPLGSLKNGFWIGLSASAVLVSPSASRAATMAKTAATRARLVATRDPARERRTGACPWRGRVRGIAEMLIRGSRPSRRGIGA